MTGKTTRQRQAEFVARQIAKGLRLVRVWIVAGKIKEFQKLARRFQK